MYAQNIVTLFSILSLFDLVLSFTSDDLRVTLSDGSKLIGRYLRSHSGRPIKGFTNIPYAKPPIGQLRFKAPEPIEKWNGEYEAINDGPICLQRHQITDLNGFGYEDCLKLNVYVPHTFEERLSNLPVLVYFHGGGFIWGSGARSSIGPDYFLDHDVILVSANYRLGPLGFLSTEDQNCPGNFGFKDQVLVLKWVRDNIQKFGGDPENVTIFGGSAGGVSVTLQMTSPLAKGLFSKAIAQSGLHIAPWALPYKGDARKRAIQLAKHFDCYKPGDLSQTIDCLRAVPAENITASSSDSDEKEIVYTPVVEPDLPGAFLTKHPCDLIAETSLNVPFLTGINYDEGLVTSANILNQPNLFEKFVNKLELVLPSTLHYNHIDPSVQETITNEIKKFYFNNNLTQENAGNVTNLIGDVLFSFPMKFYFRLRLSAAEAPSYAYLFTHRGSAGYSDLGVSHADEMIYLFPVRESLFPYTLPTIEDEQVSEAMTRMWVDFARTGNPTPDSSPFPNWYEVTEFPLNFYRIGNFHFEHKPLFGMENGGFFEDRMKFWREIATHFPVNHLNRDES